MSLGFWKPHTWQLWPVLTMACKWVHSPFSYSNYNPHFIPFTHACDFLWSLRHFSLLSLQPMLSKGMRSIFFQVHWLLIEFQSLWTERHFQLQETPSCCPASALLYNVEVFFFMARRESLQLAKAESYNVNNMIMGVTFPFVQQCNLI